LKYFVPEWNDRVDPEYDFASDSHSPGHKQDSTRNDVYIWDIFGIDKTPVDGVLVSRITIENDKRKYQHALSEGIHKALRLPQQVEIIGDCGAFGYVKHDVPPYDPLETLDFYAKLGFNYGVSVDHLAVPQFEKQREVRIRITYENGVKAFEEWSRKYREVFQLLLAVQGWEVSDYLRMYRNYMDLGATHIAFGGLARSPSSFITQVVNCLIKEIEDSKRKPQYVHFFGVARPALFPQFTQLENHGVTVGFDSASYLRKAWLSAATSELNYLTPTGRGYTAIRVPFVVGRQKLSTEGNENRDVDSERLKRLEQECLVALRDYDHDETDIENVISVLSKFNKASGGSPELSVLYRRVLTDKPWRLCDCPICKSIGIDVMIFRGNNRNRRRGFHNVNVFYEVMRKPELWTGFMKRQQDKQESPISALNGRDRVLIITECSKRKLGYNARTKAPAKNMYQGRLFKWVRRYCHVMGYDYAIISAKYGLVFPDEVIEGYEKSLQTKNDVVNLQPRVEKLLNPLIKNYDKIVVIAGEKYRDVLRNLWDDRFITVKGRGYTDLCSTLENAMPKGKLLLEF